MAKSTGNIARVGDLLEAGIDPRALRYALISVHYRASLNYTADSLDGRRLRRSPASTPSLPRSPPTRRTGPNDPDLPGVLEAATASFDAALADDLNISAGLAAVFDLVRDLNRRIDARSLSTADAARASDWLRRTDTVLAVLPDVADDLEPELAELLAERVAARAARGLGGIGPPPG